MKQGNAKKKFGIVALLSAIIGGLASPGKDNAVDKEALMQRKNGLLLNVNGPAPRRVLNQRQKRKRYRQSHHCS